MPKFTSPNATLIRWSLAWALALIASAIVFRGNPVGDWVESFLTIAALTFWLWQWWWPRRQPGCAG
jgi:hypothetical protein